jgi:hypothetical protein
MHPIILALIFASFIAFFYRVYLMDKLNGADSAQAIYGLGRRTFAPNYLFPIRKENYAAKHSALVKRANQSLMAFWLCFLLAIILGGIFELVKNTPNM